MTISQALDNAYLVLNDNVAQPRLDAEVVLSSLLLKNRSYLVAHSEEELSKKNVRDFEKLLGRRKKNEPLAYVVGTQPFYKKTFLVNKHTLIPRPETEQIIDLVKERFNTTSDLTIIDVGTGSGNIALTLADQFPNSSVYATDLCKRALKIAKINKSQLDIDNVTFIHSDLLKEFIKTNLKADLIIANLPYLTEEDLKDSPTAAEVAFEPTKALLANDQGLALIKKCIKQAATALKEKGTLYLEFHPTQTNSLLRWIKNENLPFIGEVKKDLAGLDRILILKLV